MKKEKTTLATLKRDNWSVVLETEKGIILQFKAISGKEYRCMWDKEEEKVTLVIQLGEVGEHRIVKGRAI